SGLAAADGGGSAWNPPAVVSPATRDALDEYRAFRHVARRIYTFSLDPAKLAHLVARAPERFAQVRTELLAVAGFLDQQASEAGETEPDGQL
ncbi:MAG: hypothetical protein ACREIA_24350, partial [Opitutaceae bacterium]